MCLVGQPGSTSFPFVLRPLGRNFSNGNEKNPDVRTEGRHIIVSITLPKHEKTKPHKKKEHRRLWVGTFKLLRKSQQWRSQLPDFYKSDYVRNTSVIQVPTMYVSVVLWEGKRCFKCWVIWIRYYCRRHVYLWTRLPPTVRSGLFYR